jgi:hypothetical protein
VNKRKTAFLVKRKHGGTLLLERRLRRRKVKMHRYVFGKTDCRKINPEDERLKERKRGK